MFFFILFDRPDEDIDTLRSPDDTVNRQADGADEHILDTFVPKRAKELEDLFEIHLESPIHCSQSS